ncbi:tetratricopeptide TPR_2 repeat-containing protein [Rubidibacter lacunae KORDI 51-2]|uniref:Tetratricopeptide TPR_2 repeat-containing protein n=1 Tax=Rubidibacter lacunae KORDI 51-2 TaxID=582515 RepID=U5DR53_9CHRO|nr:tetratricopeptide repeat protein [Rubidibacter lacunae]ERN42165.1 tetratricopeptide TPR_2 repeat-containing protein [Rubidibacter lacunae KORDI 51-2]
MRGSYIFLLVVGTIAASGVWGVSARAADRSPGVLLAHFDPELMAELNRAIEERPGDVAAYLQRGLAFNHLEQYEHALADFNKVIRIEPNHVDAYNYRGAMHYRLGNLMAALADFNRAIALDPDFAVVYFNRGYVRRDSGDVPGAIADFEHGAALAEQQGDPNTAAQARAIAVELQQPGL